MNADQGFRRAPGNPLRVAAGAGAAALIVTAAAAARRRSARAARDSGPARARQIPPQAAPGASPSPAAPEAVEAYRPAVGQAATSAALLLCTATALSAVAGRRRTGGKRGAAHARASRNQAGNGNGALPLEIPADMGDPWIMGAPWSADPAPVRYDAGPPRPGVLPPRREAQRTQHVDDYPSWPGRPGPGALHPDHPSWGGGRNDPRWDSTEQVLRQDSYPSWPESSSPPWRDAEPPAADDPGWGGGGRPVPYRGPVGQSPTGQSPTGPRTVLSAQAGTEFAPPGGFTPRTSLATGPGPDPRLASAPPAAYAPQPGHAHRPGYGPRAGPVPYQGLDSRPVAAAPASFAPGPGPAHQAGPVQAGPAHQAAPAHQAGPAYQPGYPPGPGSASSGPAPRADFVPRHGRVLQPGATGVMERVRPEADRVPEVSRGPSAPGQVWDAGSVELATWIINEANQQATEIRHEARDDAAAARANAKQEAAKLVQQAADQAAATLAAAELQAARVRAEILKLSADLGGVASSFTESLLSPAQPATWPKADPLPRLATSPAAKPASRSARAPATKPGVSPRRIKPETQGCRQDEKPAAQRGA